MTDERAMEILDPDHLEHYESIEPIIEACRIGMEAIRKVKELRAENAALRERLDKAVEIPDYVFGCINGKVERIFTEYLTVGELKYLEENGYSLTKEAAEARLAELKGGKE